MTTTFDNSFNLSPLAYRIVKERRELMAKLNGTALPKGHPERDQLYAKLYRLEDQLAKMDLRLEPTPLRAPPVTRRPIHLRF